MGWEDTLEISDEPVAEEKPKKASWEDTLEVSDADDEQGSLPVDPSDPESSQTNEQIERQAELEKKYGVGESAFYGAVQGIPVLGEQADELGGFLEAAGSVAGFRGLGADKLATYDREKGFETPLRWETPEEKKQSLREVYKAGRDASRQNYGERKEANPWAFGTAKFASQAAGSMGTGPMSRLNIKHGDGLLKATGKGMLQGGAESLGASEAETTDGVVVDTGLGAVLGGILAGGSQTLTKSDAAEELARRRAVKSLDPTLGQHESLARADSVDDLGKLLLDEKITRFGSNVEDQLPRLESALRSKGEELGFIRQAADAVYAERGVPAIDLSELTDTAKMGEMAQEAGTKGARSRAAAYSDEVAGLAQRPGRSISETQEMATQLADDIPYSAPRDTWTPAHKAAADLRADLVAKSEQAVRSAVPEQFPRHQELKQQFGLFKDGDRILDKSVSRSARNADIGLRDLLVAGNAGRKGGVEGAAQSVAAGLATKLARERGNSAMAVSARGISKLLKPTSYISKSKFGPVLRNAAARGLSSLFVTHQQLMADPEYRAMAEEDMLEEDGGVP